MRTKLTQQERDHYAENGFVVIPDFLDSDEFDELESAVLEVTAEMTGTGSADDSVFEATEANPFSNLVHHMNPFMTSPRIRKFSTDQRLAELTASLEGIENIRLYQDMIAVKPPWGGPTGFHMDVPRISFTADHTITYWFPLIDVGYENACLYYIPGVNKQKKAEFTGIYQMDELDKIDPSWAKIQPLAAAPVPRGGVSIHEGYAPHGTLGNMSPKPRPVFVLTQMPEDATFDGTPNLVQPGEMPVGAPLNDESRFPLVLGKASS